jgi:hypothetical protein
MTAASLPSADDLSRLADELEGLVALYEQRGGTVFPVQWVSKHHASPYRIYVAVLRVAARASDTAGLANVLRAARDADKDEGEAVQRYLLGPTT